MFSGIPEKFLKPYDPKTHEENIYKMWEESGYFNPDNLPGNRTDPYVIVLPPPNVTGVLHLGSALMAVIEDVLIRHARMAGKEALWIPGTDSAAIATQARVEKDIQKKEGKSRHDLGREELLRRIDEFVEANKTTILKQFRAIGSSLDWSRYAYTMDETRHRAVLEAFVRMYKAGLIYRGNRIVNWDPKGQTTISDDEIEYEERDAMLYTFRYFKNFPVPISTTRPETKVGDTAVAVHPDDSRYKQYVGKEFTGEFAGTTLTLRIVADGDVDKDFGTGALGVTPAHSHADWDIADRHDLPRPQVIDEKARMTKKAGELVAGLKVDEAREKIVEWLKENDLMEKEEEIKQNISKAQRSGGIVEPLPKLQWWVDVEKKFTLPHSEIPSIESGSETTLKDIMRKAVESGAIEILPNRFNNVYFNWINNLRPWCISRQIWFGHRIPVWYHEPKCIPKEGREKDVAKCINMIASIEKPKCEYCDAQYVQDEDVLDTWFSSALWTFSTFGWPEDTEDLKRFHPTTVLETGYDILFFWVARMILMSGFHLGQVPFKTVYLHGLVRDDKGRKISKSLGNNIDPIEMGEKYGMDAVRMSLLVGTAPGADSRISDNKIRAHKHFANKLWNIARFVFENTDGLDLSVSYSKKDIKIRKNFDEIIVKEVTKNINEFRLDLAADTIYHYIWHEFADMILEHSKTIFAGEGSDEKGPEFVASRKKLLYSILADGLKLLHPFMPFVTETIWQELPHKDSDMLIVAPWPQ